MANETLPIGFEGSVRNMVPATFISRTVEEANGIPFGRPAQQGTSDREVKAGIAANKFVGIATRQFGRDGQFDNNDTARLMTIGAMVVKVDVAVSAGDTVDYKNGWATSTTGGTRLVEARYETSGSGGDLVVVRLWGTNTSST